MNLRTNAGYIIADSIQIGDTEFVLGVSACQQPAMFVTWQCKGGDNFGGSRESNVQHSRRW